MFSREGINSNLLTLMKRDPPPLEITEFHHQDFESPYSEQSIFAAAIKKQYCEDGLFFWIKTLQAQDWSGREERFIPYAESALCEPIGKDVFDETVKEYSISLERRLPDSVCETDGYRTGLRMYNNWNDVAVVAELDESFVAFYWCTTA